MAVLFFYASTLFNLVLAFAVMMAWNISGGESDYDAIAIGVTSLEILLAIVAGGGYWVVRGAAIRAAEQETRRELTRTLNDRLETALTTRLKELMPAIVKEELELIVPRSVARQLGRLEDAVLVRLLDELFDRGLIEEIDKDWGYFVDPDADETKN
jgi:hypothetical protein